MTRARLLITALLFAACEDPPKLVVVEPPPPPPVILDDTCDGLDDDGDLYVDEDYVSRGPCGSDVGQCEKGVWKCAGGHEFCFGGVSPDDRADLCDGVDNDCDGRVDEDHRDVYCPGVVRFSPCHPGILQCYSGEEICVGRVNPMPEICDTVDNDCNGKVDDIKVAPEEHRQVDVVFMFDLSGSNAPNLSTQTAAIMEWLARTATTTHDYKFWMIEVAGVDWPSTWGANPHCHLDQQPPLTACEDMGTALQTLPDRSSGGREQYYDALEDMTRHIWWRPDSARLIVAFFDEDNMDSSLTQEETLLALQKEGITVVIFAGYAKVFQKIADGTGGAVLPLNPGQEQVTQALMVHVKPPCG